MSWRPYPPAVGTAYWYRRAVQVVQEVFFSPRALTRDGVDANVVDALYAVAEATDRLAAELRRFNDDYQAGR
jgi:hypothetical protein